MKRKPLDPASGIITKNMLINIIVISLLMSSAVILLYMRWYQVDVMMARTGVLILLVLLEIMRVQMIRSDYGVPMFSNKRLIGAILLSVVLILGVIYTPLSVFFQTTPPSLALWEDIGLLFVLTTVVGLGLDYVIDRWITKSSSASL